MSKSPGMKQSGYGSSIFPWIIALLLVGAWATNWFLLKDSPNRGTFGDMFGAVNALFSGLAFAGVIYAILLQRHELMLQREELSLTREELAGARAAQEQQAHTLATTAELSVLNTLVQEALIKERHLEKAKAGGAYNIDGVAVTILIESAQKERIKYIDRMKQLIEVKESQGIT